MSASKKEEYDRLRSLINQWNVDHYDIFELSQPNEDLEFHGVVRFFFQGGVGASVITKCIRVSSTATTKEVIDVLIEKFRPDMRMLSQHKYALYEVHVNGEERRLSEDENILFVQLNWGKDVREGRFLLRNEDHPTVRDPALGFDKSVLQDQGGFKRKLSKREMKEKKKRERERGKENVQVEDSVAGKLYEEAPETSFTRSISNPEAVMKRRRQQKLEKKLAQMNATNGGKDSGGTLKIYGESLRPDVPYKTLFLSTADPASAVVREAMEKYGLENQDSSLYCLVEVLLPPGGMEYHGQKLGDERVLDDNECPLAIVMQHAKHRGHIIFQLRQRSADYKKRKQKPRAASQEDLHSHTHDQRHTNVDTLPYLVEMNVRGKPKRHVLPLNVTEVVNITEVANNRTDYNGKHFLQLSGPDISPRHCVIAHTEGIVTVTPNSQNAETYVEGQRIYETTMLKHGMMVQFGRDRLYRFLDPRFDELPLQAHLSQQQQQQNKYQRAHPPEAGYDLDGRVGNVQAGDPQAWDSQQRRNVVPNSSPGGSPGGSVPSEDLLPASLEYFLDAQDRLLQTIILDVNGKQLQFKLAPTYTLYMAVRLLMSARSPMAHRPQLVAEFSNKTARLMQQSIQEHHNDPSSLAFWMANASEILHMFKQDRDVQPLSVLSQEMLAEAVQAAFHHLVRCLQGDLHRVMPAFLDPADSDREYEIEQQYNAGRPTLADVLDTLSAAMTLLRRCRVNAALTIQLFSQLFHFINMWLFNMLVGDPGLQLCTRMWGHRLKRRLGSVEAWAEKQGLELAADCHLCRIIQAAHLLQASKSSVDDVTNISSTCFKLNSLQLRSLLTHYIPEPNELPISVAFVERVVTIAENMADELTRTDGREVRLEEDSDLHLPFLLPEDGYSCETIRGIPNGLSEFVRPLENAGICRFIVNINASGSWTVYMGDEHVMIEDGKQRSPGSVLPAVPEIFTIGFSKVKGSMGLSIVAAIGEGQSEQGIYIKSVVEGGAAAQDGRLQAGDQLLEVDGKSLIGVTQDKAAELMTKTGQVVQLKVAKQAVLYHNLGSLLNQPSPSSQRAAHNKVQGPNGEAAPPPYDGRGGGGSRVVNGYGNPDKTRAPSTGNLADPRYPSRPTDPHNNRHDDPRSKSTSNLHVDTDLNRGDFHPNMKPSQSVGVLYRAYPEYPQYPAGGQDVRANDYENQPRYPPQAGQGRTYHEVQMRPSFNFIDPRQNLPGYHLGPGYHQPGPQRTSDRSSTSSRTSSTSNRDMRPQSAYFADHPHNNSTIRSQASSSSSSRPRSEDVGSKLKEWQNKYEDPRGGGYNKQVNGGNSPPYSNIGSHMKELPSQPNNTAMKSSAHERLFSQPIIPHKPGSTRQQPNLYENTSSLQNGQPLPGSHQQHRLSSIQQADNQHYIPESRPSPTSQAGLSNGVDTLQRGYQLGTSQAGLSNGVDTLQQGYQLGTSQPGLSNGVDTLQRGYQLGTSQSQRNVSQSQLRKDPRFAQDLRYAPDPRNGPVPDYRNIQPVLHNTPDVRSSQDPRNFPQSFPRGNYPQQLDQQILNNNLSISAYQDTRLSQPQQQQLADTNNHHGYHLDQLDFPPPLHNNTSHNLVVGSNMDSFDEDLPPIPPPPSQEALIDQRLAAEQHKLLQQINATNQFLTSNNRQDQKAITATTQQPAPQTQSGNNRVAGSNRDSSTSLGYQDSHRPADPTAYSNYQNVGFASNVRAASGPEPQAPPVAQPSAKYNTYENQPAKVQVKTGTQKPLSRDRMEINNRSAWDRDAKEKAEEEVQEELFRLREQEISELESRSYLNPQDQERLRKLKTEHEFQRRVREIAEKGDYEYEDDDEFAERYYNRERLIQLLKDDLEKSRDKMRELELSQQRADVVREQDRLQTLERRLEMYEKDREEQRQRMQKRQERRAKEHQDQLRQQRETREKQRQSYEEHKRQLMKEEEKLNNRREEELSKRKQFERERRQELQDQRDADEKRIRAEIRREEEERLQQQLTQEKQQRLDQSRPIVVGEEKRRLDALTNNQPSDSTTSQYANITTSASSSLAPPTPERKSSYDTFMQRASFRASSNSDQPPPSNLSSVTSFGLPSALRNTQDPQQPTAKKSVSFNTQMNTYKERTPNHSQSSYKSSSTSSQQSVDQSLPPPSFSLDSDVFESNAPPLNGDHRPEENPQPDPYNTSSNSSTPSVIGTQEIYRDPRKRIEAKIAWQSSSSRSTGTDRMSFNDKMKYFAKEAGEDTIKYKPKSSRTLREIESQLNGQ